MSLTDDAIAAYNESLERQKETDAAYRKSLEPHALKDCLELFGREPDEIDGNEVVIDGLRMLLRTRNLDHRTISVRELEICCVECQDVYFKEFNDLAGLGGLLQNPPSHGYSCPHYPKTTVNAQIRLADALREILENN